jgi:hypothetical protein
VKWLRSSGIVAEKGRLVKVKLIRSPAFPGSDKPEKKTFNHAPAKNTGQAGNNGTLRKILNALTSCEKIAFKQKSGRLSGRPDCASIFC